jgi:RNA polymerase sigma-70 factor (ECF subfamily)
MNDDDLSGRALPFRASDEKGVVADRAEEAFRRHYADVFRYLRRRVPTDHEAEELAQVVFADSARRLDALKDDQAPLLAWLYTVAQRRLADRARQLARRETLAQLEATRMQVVGELDYRSDLAGALERALARLPEQQRSVVVLKQLRGISFAEIAAELDSTEAACKMRFARGLETVRAELEREGLAP